MLSEHCVTIKKKTAPEVMSLDARMYIYVCTDN